MVSLFVYPAIEAHKPYREITRETFLKCHYGNELTYRPKNVPFTVALPDYLSRVMDEIKWLPKNPAERQERLDNLFMYEYGGVNLCGSQIRGKGLREGGDRLSRDIRDLDGPTALEIIAWGVGVFREVNTEQDTSYEKVMGKDPLPKLTSKHIKILQHHLVRTLEDEVDENGDYTNRMIRTVTPFESTNLILADSYGELEQIVKRRHETTFLTIYLNQLIRTAEFIYFRSGKFFAPRCFGIKGITKAWVNHTKLGVWQEPPKSVNELVERADFILGNTLIDENPVEVTVCKEFYEGSL